MIDNRIYGNARELTTTISDAYRFTGRRYDSDTGEHYFRARHYSPSVGRFSSADPYAPEELNYTYAGGNPLAFTDPSGLKLVWHNDELKNVAKYLSDNSKGAEVALHSLDIADQYIHIWGRSHSPIFFLGSSRSTVTGDEGCRVFSKGDVWISPEAVWLNWDFPRSINDRLFPKVMPMENLYEHFEKHRTPTKTKRKIVLAVVLAHELVGHVYSVFLDPNLSNESEAKQERKAYATEDWIRAQLRLPKRFRDRALKNNNY